MPVLPANLISPLDKRNAGRKTTVTKVSYQGEEIPALGSQGHFVSGKRRVMTERQMSRERNMGEAPLEGSEIWAGQGETKTSP